MNPSGMVSTDGGKSWTGLGFTTLAANPPDNHLIGYAQIGGNLFAATGHAVYRSSDNGKTFTSASYGLGGGISSITSMGSALYVSTAGGVFVSQNNGDLWLPLIGGLKINRPYCFDVIGKSLVVGGENGVIQIHNNPLPSLVPASAASFYITKSSPRTCAVRTGGLCQVHGNKGRLSPPNNLRSPPYI